MVGAPERLLLRLEWRVIRRLDGRVQGAYRTPYRGSGLDFAGLRGYVEEDDARHIDWNATARLDEPQVRQYTEDRELTVWLVLDRSASMTVGRPCHGKHEVLGELALILARLFGRGGNRVGAVLHDGVAARVVPPGVGRVHALRIGYELERTAAAVPAPVTTDFAVMLDAVASLARRRSLIVVVSDFIGTGEWDRPLLVDSGDPLFRSRFRAGVATRDAELSGRMRRAGVPLHRIDTDRDPVESLVEVVAATRWRRA